MEMKLNAGLTKFGKHRFKVLDMILNCIRCWCCNSV